MATTKEHDTTIKVFTLNCWGIKFLSSFRLERIKAITNHLVSSDYDIVVLQELWLASDFDFLSRTVEHALPFSHFFEAGFGGSGMCVLSKSRIEHAAFHEFPLCGYPHRPWEGDWFGGKGLGICCLRHHGFSIHVFTSHYHAEYSKLNDKFLGHRVVQACDSANWIKITSEASDLTIYAGDFNATPASLVYQLLRHVTPMKDAWFEANGYDGGETSETPCNSFTSQSALRVCPLGQRIDYILYNAGPNIEANTVTSRIALPDRVPGTSYSFSDHDAVTATLSISRVIGKRSSVSSAATCRNVMSQCMSTIRESRVAVEKGSIVYVVVLLLSLLLLLATFASGLITNPLENILVDVALFIPRLILSTIIAYSFSMAVLFNRREQRVLRSSEKSLQMLLNCDDDDVSSDSSP